MGVCVLITGTKNYSGSNTGEPQYGMTRGLQNPTGRTSIKETEVEGTDIDSPVNFYSGRTTESSKFKLKTVISLVLQNQCKDCRTQQSIGSDYRQNVYIQRVFEQNKRYICEFKINLCSRFSVWVLREVPYGGRSESIPEKPM